MKFSDLLGGGSGDADTPGGVPAVGGSGKGASGAATMFGDGPTRTRGAGGSPWLIVAGVAVIALVLWFILKNK